jgi:hypothetical protein
VYGNTPYEMNYEELSRFNPKNKIMSLMKNNDEKEEV